MGQIGRQRAAQTFLNQRKAALGLRETERCANIAQRVHDDVLRAQAFAQCQCPFTPRQRFVQFGGQHVN